MSPPRAHVASDDSEFDIEFLSHLQAEGFQTTYIALLPPKSSTPTTKLDLTPLRHIADDLERDESYALIAFGSAATACLDFYSTTQPNIAALITYYPTTIPNPKLKFPPNLRTLTHLAASQSFAPAFQSCYTYPSVHPGFAEHDLEDYNATAASLSWSRTLALLRSAFNSPIDLERIWEAHLAAKTRDATATLRTMVAQDPAVNHVPTLTGGRGQEALLAFYADYVIPCNPPSTTTRLLSRTIGADRLVDEFVLSFEHSQEIPWLLPGVPATGKKVSVAVVAVVGFRGGKVLRESVYWDQASVLVQVGLLDAGLVTAGMREVGVERLPVAGAEAARKVLDEGAELSNGLIKGWKGRAKARGESGVGMPVRPKKVAGGL